MPVVVITPSKATPKKVCKYIMQEKKTCNELKFSSYCEPDHFDKDFEMVQDAHNRCQKIDSRKYYHIKLSWATKDEVTPEHAKEMAMRFCEETNLRGCQYAGSIHTDTKTIHAHIVVNNVRVEDNEYGKAGYSYQATKSGRELMMEKANEIAKEYGMLYSLVKPDKEAEKRISREEIEVQRKGKTSWKDTLREKINEAIEKTQSFDGFRKYLHDEHSVDVMEGKNGKLKYFPNGFHEGEKGCPARRLGAEYERDRIENKFMERNMEYERERY